MYFSWLLLSEKPHFNADGYFKAFLQKDDKPLVLVVFLKRCLHFERKTKRCCCVLTRLRKNIIIL